MKKGYPKEVALFTHKHHTTKRQNYFLFLLQRSHKKAKSAITIYWYFTRGFLLIKREKCPRISVLVRQFPVFGPLSTFSDPFPNQTDYFLLLPAGQPPARHSASKIRRSGGYIAPHRFGPPWTAPKRHAPGHA